MAAAPADAQGETAEQRKIRELAAEVALLKAQMASGTKRGAAAAAEPELQTLGDYVYARMMKDGRLRPELVGELQRTRKFTPTSRPFGDLLASLIDRSPAAAPAEGASSPPPDQRAYADAFEAFLAASDVLMEQRCPFAPLYAAGAPTSGKLGSASVTTLRVNTVLARVVTADGTEVLSLLDPLLPYTVAAAALHVAVLLGAAARMEAFDIVLDTPEFLARVLLNECSAGAVYGTLVSGLVGATPPRFVPPPPLAAGVVTRTAAVAAAAAAAAAAEAPKAFAAAYMKTFTQFGAATPPAAAAAAVAAAVAATAPVLQLDGFYRLVYAAALLGCTSAESAELVYRIAIDTTTAASEWSWGERSYDRTLDVLRARRDTLPERVAPVPPGFEGIGLAALAFRSSGADTAPSPELVAWYEEMFPGAAADTTWVASGRGARASVLAYASPAVHTDMTIEEAISLDKPPGGKSAPVVLFVPRAAPGDTPTTVVRALIGERCVARTSSWRHLSVGRAWCGEADLVLELVTIRAAMRTTLASLNGGGFAWFATPREPPGGFPASVTPPLALAYDTTRHVTSYARWKREVWAPAPAEMEPVANGPAWEHQYALAEDAHCLLTLWWNTLVRIGRHEPYARKDVLYEYDWADMRASTEHRFVAMLYWLIFKSSWASRSPLAPLADLRRAIAPGEGAYNRLVATLAERGRASAQFVAPLAGSGGLKSAKAALGGPLVVSNPTHALLAASLAHGGAMLPSRRETYVAGSPAERYAVVWSLFETAGDKQGSLFGVFEELVGSSALSTGHNTDTHVLYVPLVTRKDAREDARSDSAPLVLALFTNALTTEALLDPDSDEELVYALYPESGAAAAAAAAATNGVSDRLAPLLLYALHTASAVLSMATRRWGLTLTGSPRTIGRETLEGPARFAYDYVTLLPVDTYDEPLVKKLYYLLDALFQAIGPATPNGFVLGPREWDFVRRYLFSFSELEMAPAEGTQLTPLLKTYTYVIDKIREHNEGLALSLSTAVADATIAAAAVAELPGEQTELSACACASALTSADADADASPAEAQESSPPPLAPDATLPATSCAPPSLAPDAAPTDTSETAAVVQPAEAAVTVEQPVPVFLTEPPESPGSLAFLDAAASPAWVHVEPPATADADAPVPTAAEVVEPSSAPAHVVPVAVSASPPVPAAATAAPVPVSVTSAIVGARLAALAHDPAAVRAHCSTLASALRRTAELSASSSASALHNRSLVAYSVSLPAGTNVHERWWASLAESGASIAEYGGCTDAAAALRDASRALDTLDRGAPV